MQSCIFADNLRRLMDRRGVTQPVLARATGITQSTLSRLLNGKSEASVSELSRLRDYFGVPLEELVDPWTAHVRAIRESAQVVETLPLSEREKQRVFDEIAEWKGRALAAESELARVKKRLREIGAQIERMGSSENG
jgi:transcriptional regulator with XRE-family HTH domain